MGSGQKSCRDRDIEYSRLCRKYNEEPKTEKIQRGLNDSVTILDSYSPHFDELKKRERNEQS